MEAKAKQNLNPLAAEFTPGGALHMQTKQTGVRNKRPGKIQGAWANDVQSQRGRVRGRGAGRGRGVGRGSWRGTGRGTTHERNAWCSRNPYSESRPKDLSQQDLPESRNFGQPQDVREVVFMQPDGPVDVQMPTEPKMIEEDGVHVISTEPSGKSEVTLKRNFLNVEEADEAFVSLQEEIDWIQQFNKNRAGEEYREPRMVCWYGEHPYAYSRVRMEAKEEWPPVLLKLKEKIERENSLTFNSVLANKYRNEKDGVAWHSDDEYGLRDQPKIASLSLGETRMFEMRKKPPKGCNPYDYDYSESEKLKVPLTHGSLLLMAGYTQDDWQHQVPKEYHAKNMRINLTFRTIYPDDRFHKPYRPKDCSQ